MARKPRIHFPGALYHVMLRGNAGQDIFFSEEDYCHLYLLLQEGVFRFGYRIHALCLMRNHLHLAIQVTDIPLSKGMQNLAFRYTRWVNKRMQRIGHLFQGRYKAILVDADDYLLELCRYIHLNPVRAELVNDPADYPWSGHLAYLGRDALPCLTTDWVLAQFASEVTTARSRYERFIWEGIGEGRREEFHRGNVEGRLLGDEPFQTKVLTTPDIKPGRPVALSQVVDSVCHALGLDKRLLTAPGKHRRAAKARALVGLLALEMGSATLTETACFLKRDPATLSNAIRRLKRRLATDPALGTLTARIRESVTGDCKQHKYQ